MNGVAVAWLALLATVVVETLCTGRDAWLLSGSRNALDAVDQQDPKSHRAEREAPLYLQAAILQVDLRGEQEALLCAANVPLLPDRDLVVNLDFRNPPGTVLQEEQQGRGARAGMIRMPGERQIMRRAQLPVGFSPASVWRTQPGLDLLCGLQVRDQESGEQVVRLGSSSRGSWQQFGFGLGGDVESVRLLDGVPAIVAKRQGSFVLLRVSRQPVVSARVATRAFWREACRVMPARQLTAGDGEVVRDAASDAARAAVLLRLPEVAERLRADHDEWLNQSDDSWAGLLAGHWSRGVEAEFGLYPRFPSDPYACSFVRRARELQPSAVHAARFDDWLPGRGWSSWWLAIGASLLLVLWVLRAPARSQPHILISGSALVLLWISYWVDASGFGKLAFALLFAFHLVPRMPRSTGGIYRALAAIALLATLLSAARYSGLAPLGPSLDALALLGHPACWVVIARWVLTDATWRARKTYLLFLASLVVVTAVEGLMRIGVALPTARAVGVVALWTGTLLLLWFCAIGRYREWHAGAVREVAA